MQREIMTFIIPLPLSLIHIWDTFKTLFEKGISMEAKAFAVGLRIQHPQKQINLSQYGMEDPGILGAAPYKVTRQTSNQRGVYSFCMCPGGFVVNASSEPGHLAVNGMSNHARNGINANSALIVTVTPEDFPEMTAMGGIAFQRHLEELAYRAGAVSYTHLDVYKRQLGNRDIGAHGQSGR